MLIKQKIKSLLIALTMVVPILSLENQNAIADSSFYVENQSEKDVFYLYIIDSNNSDWGENLIEKGDLMDKEKLTFYLPEYHTCDYAIKVIFDNYTEFARQIDLCSNSHIIINSQEIITKE